jgi:hypothetical protein
VFLVRYPDDPFDTGSRNSVHPCGIFQDLTGNEALYMHTEGLTLNRLLLFAAARHDWIPVTVAGSFAGHGYCAEHPWLRPFGSSELVQGDKDGTMHPNGPGHEAVADEVLHGYAAPFVPRVQIGNATVTFDAVKLVDRQATQPNGLAPDHTAAAFFFQTSSQQYGVPISAPALMSYPAHTTTRISMVDETPLPPGISQRVAVYNKDPLVIEVHTTSLPLRISSARRLVRRIRHDERTDPRDDPVDPYPPANPAPRALRLTVSHGAGDSYGASSSTGVGAGIHTATRTTAIGTIQVRYHVTFEPLAATAGR